MVPSAARPASTREARGPQVRGHDRGARELGRAADDGGVPLDGDVGAHAHQLATCMKRFSKMVSRDAPSAPGPRTSGP